MEACIQVSENNKVDIREIKDTNGHRNEIPLTEAQKQELKQYAIRLGFPEEQITLVHEDGTTPTGILGDHLFINNDALPTKTLSNNPNDLISGKGTIAHEVVGHYETVIKGTAKSLGEYDDAGKWISNSRNIALDEAQASIRAARFAPELSYEERSILIKDALQRLAHEGLKINDVRHLLDITER